MTNAIITTFAVWTVTNLLVAGREAGPFDMLHVFRDTIGVKWNEHSKAYGSNVFAEMFCCFHCLSLWVSVPFAVYFFPNQVILHTLALSGGAIMIDRINNG